jgi:OOP family OmpA-OmpF porin
MRKIISGVSLLALLVLPGWAAADGEKHFYAGAALNLFKLDKDRGPDIDDPVTGSIGVGYQFNENWAADLFLGTDLSGDTSFTPLTLNAYRFFGTKSWKPYISAGFSSFSFDSDQVTESTTEEIQAGFGVSTMLSDKMEMRIGYQHFYDLGGESNNDDAVGLVFNWHFKKPKAAMAVAEPESVPVQKEVVDTFELLVEFEFDKSNIKTVYEPQFRNIGTVLTESTEITMTIEGHTDWTGTDEYNQGLSERRANAVKQKFIAEYGISPNRIDIVGYGESRPIADNNTSQGRQRNRRAISVILRPRMVTE